MLISSWGKDKSKRAKDFNRSFTSSTNGEQAIYSPFHSYYSPSFPPPPPTITSTKASKISLGLLTKDG
jgi:hypothetical protein